jgi:hypothetical protein
MRLMANSAAPSAGRVFISYRREETAYAAGWLFNNLADRFGRSQIFKDIDSVEPGDNFVDRWHRSPRLGRSLSPQQLDFYDCPIAADESARTETPFWIIEAANSVLSPCAFWMSALMPESVNASPLLHRCRRALSRP